MLSMSTRQRDSLTGLYAAVQFPTHPVLYYAAEVDKK